MIDILIPCYNSHETIDRCIGSLIMQNYKDFKITLINDGGKDYTEVIDRYKDLLNIREIGYEENKGIGYARNFGIENTEEEYFMFIDSDDVLYNPFALDELNSLAEDKSRVLIVGGIAIENEKGLVEIKQQNTNFLHGKLFKRSFIKKYKIRFKESSCCEDIGFLTICLLLLDDKKYKIHFSNLTVYGWLYNPNSLGRKDRIKWECCEVIKGYVDNLIYAFDVIKKKHVNTLEVIVYKCIFMLKTIIQYANTVDNYPQYEEYNLIALKRMYNTVYKKVKYRITENILEFSFNKLKVKQEDREKFIKILLILDKLGE